MPSASLRGFPPCLLHDSSGLPQGPLRPPAASQRPPPGAPTGTQDLPRTLLRLPPARTGVLSAVRISAGLRPSSTDWASFFRPHLGDWEVVPIPSTGQAGEGSSGQVSSLWIRGRRISTGCGQKNDPQPVHGVVHRPPTGLGRLSPAIFGFSTCLSTVRQRDAPRHRVE
jgi:hypothetical protein